MVWKINKNDINKREETEEFENLELIENEPKNENKIKAVVLQNKEDDNIDASDQYIQNNILTLIQEGKIKNKEILNTVQKYNLFNNNEKIIKNYH